MGQLNQCILLSTQLIVVTVTWSTVMQQNSVFEIGPHGCSTMVVLVVKTQSQSPWPKQCRWLRQFSKYSNSEKTWAFLEITRVIWHVFCLSLFNNFSNSLLYFRQRDTTLWCLDTEYKIEMENFLYHKAWIGFFWPGRYSFN